MRFRFCGDLDAPEWLMAEMAVLSRISSVRMKILSKQVVLHLLGTHIDYEKVLKLTKDTFDSASDVKAAVAGIDFILANSAKYDVDFDTLTQEIQQMGLPKENADALVKSFRDNKDVLRQRLASQSFSLQRLRSLEWRADCVLGSNKLEEINKPAVQLRVTTEPPSGGGAAQEASFSMTMDKFQVMYSGLRTARQLMDTLE